MSGPGYRRPDGAEVRLGIVQRRRLQSCAEAPQRAGARNPSFLRLTFERFVTDAPYVSPRTGQPTTDRLYTITAEGHRFLAIGRVR